jgi:hemerythrin-like domain-containing protein
MPVSIGASENSFANPIGLLSDCHRRIERFLQALLTVATRVAGGSLDAEHRRVLETALKYFREAAPKHTADEEEDLFPKLRQLTSPRVSTVLADVDRLEAEHKTAEASHRKIEDLCERWLGQDFLPPEDAAHLRRLLTSLSDLYRTHIRMEEEQVFPAAQAELSESELQAIGRRMATRRGVLFIPERAVMTNILLRQTQPAHD